MIICIFMGFTKNLHNLSKSRIDGLSDFACYLVCSYVRMCALFLESVVSNECDKRWE